MKDRIAKCIVHEGIVYGYEANKSAFANQYLNIPERERKINLHVVRDNPETIYIHDDVNLNILKVKIKDCLFVYKDEFEKYPEYFI
jgi:hypothetical protein